MKTFIILFFSIINGLYAPVHPPIEIDQKLVRSFDSSFPDAKEVAWQDVGSAYEVYFLQAGIRNKIVYSKDGSFVQLNRYYKAETLPYHIRLLVKNIFPEQKIFGITEISSISQEDKRADVVYHIILEDANRWYLVKMDQEGRWSFIKKSRKA